AFVVRPGEAVSPEVTVVQAANGRRGCVETSLLRPVLRGEHIAPWRLVAPNECIVWTHAPNASALERLPTHAARWLTPWRRQLSMRADGRTGAWRLSTIPRLDDVTPSSSSSVGVCMQHAGSYLPCRTQWEYRGWRAARRPARGHACRLRLAT